jgi:tetratricopeptide (TPR) repeat protein
MKRLMLAALVAMFVLGLASWARAEGLFKDDPAKKDDPAAKAAAPAAGQAEPAVAEGKDLLPAAAKKVIDDKVAMAEKMLQAAKEELAKPEGKANLKNADGYKIRAYGFYIGAMLEARKAAASARKKEDKAAITEQFEKPNKEKAIEILLGLAGAAADKKDFRTAAQYYNEVLKLDPDNVTAKEKLKALAEQAKANPKDTKSSGSKGGGDSTNRNDPSKGADGSRTGGQKRPGDYTGGSGRW